MIEDTIEEFDWKDFEEIVADIFTDNNFKVKQNFRFKTKRRYEIDVLAIKDNVVLCADCKQWGKRRYKKTSLKYYVREQERRVKDKKVSKKKSSSAEFVEDKNSENTSDHRDLVAGGFD